jgi:hypothetical protein
MTLILQDNTTDYTLYFNVSDLEADTYRFELKSQYSNLVILDTPADFISSNSRYTSFDIEVSPEMPEEHLNGIYEYRLYTTTQNIDTGLLKLVTGSGSTPNTVQYESNNEDQEAPVYFRPNY